MGRSAYARKGLERKGTRRVEAPGRAAIAVPAIAIPIARRGAIRSPNWVGRVLSRFGLHCARRRMPVS